MAGGEPDGEEGRGDASREEGTLRVEVVHALPTRQRLVELTVPVGTTARQAAIRSGLDQEFPGLDLMRNPIGIFGEVVKDTRVLQPGDRVELYRPLEMDPRDARRQRVLTIPD